MKKFKIIMLILFVSLIGINSVEAAKNPYKKSGPYGTNCTWYVWNKVNEKTNIALPSWGNAKNWYKDAQNDGYEVGTTPKAKSIIVWGTWTSYGHVGYVEKVTNTTMYIWDSSRACNDEEDPEFIKCMDESINQQTSEECFANAKKIACEYEISPDYYGRTGFIYLNNIPTTTTKKKTTSTTKTTTTKKKSTTSTTTSKTTTTTSSSSKETTINTVTTTKNNQKKIETSNKKELPNILIITCIIIISLIIILSIKKHHK